MTDVRAIADSVNTFSTLSVEDTMRFRDLVSRLTAYADRFGFGSSLGIDMEW